jgi:nucleoside-diphosphate-sugar epimerase
MSQMKEQTSRTLVITGSSGFVGEKLATIALERGFEVIGIDSRKSSVLKCQQITLDLINEDFYHLIPKGSSVIHLASLSTDSLCRENPVLAVDANLKATMLVLNNSKKAEAEHFIFASSEWVYPEKSDFVEQRETDRLELTDLNSLYAISKLVGESLIRTSSEIPYTLLRFGIIYGPRALPGSSAESLALKVFNNEEISVGSANTARRFIYVDDLVEGILKVVELGASKMNSLPINLAGSELISLSKVVETVNRLLGKSISVIDGGKQASIRNPLINLSIEKLGWSPKTDFSTGIQNCIHAMTSKSKLEVEN